MDYWDVIRNFPAAYDKRRASERLEAITDRVMLEGASGRRIEYDEHGHKRPEPTGRKNTVELVDFGKHMRYLERLAGLPDVIQDKPTESKSKGLEALNLLSKAFGGGGV